jgi:glycosyltransferase involved in cell wall biosynthesis
MAAGKPVVALRAGGVAETVVDGVTGVLYDSASAAALLEAIEEFEARLFDGAVIRARAELFDTAVFRARWRSLFARLGVDPSLYSLA